MASIKDLKRMCDFYPHCSGCPIKSILTCSVYRLPDNIEEIIDKWVAEHPVKTYAMDFFSKFPDAPRKVAGIPIPCVGSIYPEFYDKDCLECECSECWNQEMKEGAKNDL